MGAFASGERRAVPSEAGGNLSPISTACVGRPLTSYEMLLRSIFGNPHHRRITARRTVTSTAWTVPIPQERVQEFRDLLADLNKDLSGLAERAREVGYHRERMWLQTNQDGSGSSSSTSNSTMV